jgi:imidazolonepropionase-like amidohydrolase
MKKILHIFIVFGVFSLSASAQDKGSVFIENATLVTVTDDIIENGDILITNGVITQIGTDLSAPAGVTVIDGTGKFVMPGIIDAHSHLNTVSTNEARNPVTAEVTMEESIDPNEVSIYRALAGGVTSIHLMHGSANVIGGQGETLKLRYGTTQDGMRFDGAKRTIKFALGENPTRVHGQGNGILPRTRMGVEQIIRSHFDEALDYRVKREAYLSAKQKYESDRRGRTAPPVPVAKNLRYDVLNDIIDGEILVHCHSYRADEILMLMRVFNDYGIKNYTFQHANEAFKVAPEIAKNGAYTSVFADWWAYKFEVYYSTAFNATILNENGVTNSINSDSNELIRHLNHEAAKTVRYGQTSEADALKMITINPAMQLGIADKVGSLEVVKQGDIAIWSGHPLSIYSKVEQTYIDGTNILTWLMIP